MLYNSVVRALVVVRSYHKYAVTPDLVRLFRMRECYSCVVRSRSKNELRPPGYMLLAECEQSLSLIVRKRCRLARRTPYD